MQYPGIDQAKSSKLLGKALREQSRGNRKEAILLFRKILKLDPDHLDAHYLLGTACAEMEDFESAEKHLSAALKLRPDSPMVLNNLAGVFRQTGRYLQAVALYEQAVAIDPYLREAFANLGFLYREMGQHQLAIRHYLRAAVLLPESVDVLHGLASAYKNAGDFPAAKDYFTRVLALKPDHVEARFLVDAISGAVPDHPPEQYVADMFDGYAARFDKHLVDDLGYRTPGLLVDAIAALCGEQHRFSRVIDLGCGTGLVGPRIRPVAEYLVGVDLSEKMLSQARSKRAYDELHRADIVDFLSGRQGFDLFIAADVLVYLGNLDPLFTALRSAALPGALIAVSTESLDAEGGYALLPTGRYAHSEAYVRDLAFKHGFRIESLQRHDIRKDGNTWIGGHICCLRNSSQAPT